MEWPAAAGVVDDRGYCGRGPAQVSASGVGTVFALLFVRLEKLLFYKGIFFQCPVFFLYALLFPPFSCLRNLFTEFT